MLIGARVPVLVLTLLVNTLLVLHGASAQAPRIGVEVSGSLISLAYDDLPNRWDRALRPSFGVMGFVQVPLRSRLSVQPGLRYVRLGNRIDFDYEVELGGPGGRNTERSVGSFTITHDFLTLPVRLRYEALEERLFVTAGPEAGWLIASRSVLDQRQPESYEQEQDITDRLNRFNLVLTVGVGTHVVLGGGHALRLQALYGHGLIGLAKPEYWGVDWKTRAFSIGVGYAF